jgi:omega-6 fatty acid desaturase (delta-12 desaturase)
MENMKNEVVGQAVSDRSWEKIIMKYNRPILFKSIWQICNSFIPYAILWFIMYRSLEYSYWITLPLSVLASGFLIRLFIIFHDCGHGSFFSSKRANSVVGVIMGILTFTPYFMWSYQHRIHHATSGNLDKRGTGDIWTMTVEEYQKSSAKTRFFYRLLRNPFILFTFGPVFVISFQHRVTHNTMTKKEKINVYFTNIMILLMAASISLLIGIKAYLLIQLPILLFSHSAGLWLFYVQHQYEDASWERESKWDYKTAAIKGSSFLKLPVILQWFTGNIGFHHVHHLSSRIPNYNLARCHYENDIFREVKIIDIFASFKTLRLSLWDEANRRMTSFRRIAIRSRNLA